MMGKCNGGKGKKKHTGCDLRKFFRTTCTKDMFDVSRSAYCIHQRDPCIIADGRNKSNCILTVSPTSSSHMFLARQKPALSVTSKPLLPNREPTLASTVAGTRRVSTSSRVCSRLRCLDNHILPQQG